MRFQLTRRTGCYGFTLLELLVAMGIVALLVAVLIPVMGTMRERARKAKCLSHLRLIHSGFTGHINDKGNWPQLPEEDKERGLSESEFFEFWVASLEPYGVPEEAWICPSDRRFERLIEQEGKKVFRGSYVATMFDEKAATPFKWNQPWVMERAGFHRGGAHVLMPDGSVNSSKNPFAGR